jgi:hypothetical protein
MGQTQTTLSTPIQTRRDSAAATLRHRPPWNRFGKIASAAAIAAMLVAIAAYGLRQEAIRAPVNAPPQTATAQPPHPAFSRAEESYIQALWPVHAEVETVTARLSLGVILYKEDDLDRADLKNRVAIALAAYSNAEARITALQPPPSLQAQHDAYLAAVRQFKASALEAGRMFEDANEDHLLASYALRQAGADRIREIGGRFWRDEFPPN